MRGLFRLGLNLLSIGSESRFRRRLKQQRQQQQRECGGENDSVDDDSCEWLTIGMRVHGLLASTAGSGAAGMQEVTADPPVKAAH